MPRPIRESPSDSIRQDTALDNTYRMPASFGEGVLRTTALKSTAIANAGMTKQSLYELDRGAVGGAAYDRALVPMGSISRRTDSIKSLSTGNQGKALSADNALPPRPRVASGLYSSL